MVFFLMISLPLKNVNDLLINKFLRYNNNNNNSLINITIQLNKGLIVLGSYLQLNSKENFVIVICSTTPPTVFANKYWLQAKFNS